MDKGTRGNHPTGNPFCQSPLFSYLRAGLRREPSTHPFTAATGTRREAAPTGVMTIALNPQVRVAAS